MSFLSTLGGFFTFGEGFDIWDIPSAVGRGLGNAFEGVGSAVGAAFDGDPETGVWDGFKSGFAPAATAVGAVGAVGAPSGAGSSPYDVLVGGGSAAAPSGAAPGGEADIDDLTTAQLVNKMYRDSLKSDKTSFADIAIALSPVAISLMNSKNAKKENKKDREHEDELQDEMIQYQLLNQQRAQEHQNSLATMQANLQLRNAVQQVQQVAGDGVSIGGGRNVIGERKKKKGA